MKMNKSHSVTLKQDQGFFFFFSNNNYSSHDCRHIYTPFCDLLPNNFFVTFYLFIGNSLNHLKTRNKVI